MAEHDGGGSLALAISNGMVKLIADTTGRGPTKARTTIGRDHVLVMLRDTLTRGERKLAESGFTEEVMQIRRRYQDIMRADASTMIENLLDRRVIGFMSDNHLEPDLAAEVFVLEPAPGDGAGHVAEADSSAAERAGRG